MRLVFVTSLVPAGEPTTGYEIANQSIVDALRRNGAAVTSLGFNWAGTHALNDEKSIILGEVDVRSETARAAEKANWVAKALVNSLTISSAKLRVVTDAEIRAALAKAEPFDAYVINGVTMGGAFPTLFRDKPSLYVAHNVEHISAEENALSADGVVKRFFFRREAKLLKELELSLAARAAFTFTLAEEDRHPLGVASPEQSAVLPLVIKRHSPQFLSERIISYDAGLIGTWTWEPNRVGLEWFMEKVVPHLPGGFKIAVAGHIPAGFDAMPPQVDVLGRVASAIDFVRSCAVIPLVAQAGTGVQLKTIETFEFGLPSVATTRSLRGIVNIPPNCREINDPQRFAAALVEVASLAKSGAKVDCDGSKFYGSQIKSQDEAAQTALARLGRHLKSPVRKAA